MNTSSPLDMQHGATLVVGLIMLTLITLMISSAFTLSASNLQSVGNMQNRDEAIAAANKAIEQVLSSPFTNVPAAESIDVDINNDGNTDYTVNLAKPTCINALKLAGAGAPPSSISLGSSFSVSSSTYYDTLWDLDATVVDARHNGTSIRERQGVRVMLTQAQYLLVCT